MMHSTDALCSKVVAPPTIHGLAMRVLSDAYLAKGENEAGLRVRAQNPAQLCRAPRTAVVSRTSHSCRVTHLAQLCFALRRGQTVPATFEERPEFQPTLTS